MSGHCECPESRTGLTCGHAAMWLIQVGTRKTDAQLCCGTHLNRTCALMLAAEERRGAVLTVTEVRT